MHASSDRDPDDTNMSREIPLPNSANNPSTSTKYNPSTSSQQQDVIIIGKEQPIECPTCIQFFSFDEIAEHADMCCDIWVGSVNHGCASGEESSSPQASPQQVVATHDTKDIKDCILQIKAATMTDKVVRLYIRRTCMWSDFKDSRSNGKVSPTDQVKIVFVGESAIDDGGPRREFLSGIIYIKYFLNS